MKESILNVGVVLDKADQKQINGGGGCCTYHWSTGYTGECCPPR